jgi:hypothetical protein
MKERNIGALVYYKPAYGLKLLRTKSSVLNVSITPLKKYIQEWALQTPYSGGFLQSH